MAKMGRPPKEISEEQVRQLASIQCTMIEIASVVDCSVDTLERRFADIIKTGREQGKSSLRRAQFATAMKGNASLLIWLGKQVLDQKEDNTLHVPPETTKNFVSMMEQIKQMQKERQLNKSTNEKPLVSEGKI